MWYTYQKLRNYGERYYCRYFPSSKRFLEKLTQKADDTILAKKVFDELAFLIDEPKLIESNIRFLVARHKNKRYILAHLQKKWFQKQEIERILEETFESNTTSLLDQRSTKLKIENLLKKWKSKKYIFQQLWESSFDREILEEIFQELEITDEFQNIQKFVEKHSEKYSGQKMMSKLFAQGFSYDEIKKFFSQK